MNKENNKRQELKDKIARTIKTQQYQDALTHIDEYLRHNFTDGDQSNIILHKAYCLTKIGQTEEAFNLINTVKIFHQYVITYVYICLKAGKYLEALDMLKSYNYDRILYSGYYAHAYFGLGEIKRGYHMLGEVAKHFNPYPQDILAHLLSIYHDTNLKNVFTKKDFNEQCHSFLVNDFQKCKKYSTQFFSQEAFHFFTKDNNDNNICCSGTSFYQYQSLNLNTISNIQNSCVHFGEYSKFNDPADPPIKLNSYFEPLHEIMKDIRIACFTTKNNNFLMWSHYADKHKGICIEYDIEAFLKREDTYPILFQKVRYKENLSFRDEGRLQVSDPYTETQTIWDTNILGLFTVKPEEWKYEDEYRLIGYFTDKPSLFSFDNNNTHTSSIPIKSIYMGKDISSTNRKIIENMIKDTDIQLFIMKPNLTNLYQLISEKVKLLSL